MICTLATKEFVVGLTSKTTSVLGFKDKMSARPPPPVLPPPDAKLALGDWASENDNVEAANGNMQYEFSRTGEEEVL